MNLFGLSPGELFLIMMVAMVVLGPEKLPETAASVGKWIREFRRATQELTQQFAEENPFAEIQRALTLVDEPVTQPVAPSQAVTSEAEPVVTPMAVPEVPAPVPAPVAAPVLSAPPIIRSDYFSRPAAYAAIQDRWTHSGIEDFAERVSRRLGPAITAPIGSEWTHGVPVAIPRTEVAALGVVDGPGDEGSANGHIATLESEADLKAPPDSPTEDAMPAAEPEPSMAAAVAEDPTPAGPSELAPDATLATESPETESPVVDPDRSVHVEPQPNGTFRYQTDRTEPEPVGIGAGSDSAESNEGHRT